MKSVVLKVRHILLLVIMTGIICFAAAAEEQKEQANPEVMSSLEQRMQKRISVNFRGTPIDDVIRVMAAQADVDIIKSPKVVGEVTTTLTDIPLSEALTNILAAQGYGYVTSKNMIRVAPLSEINNQDEKLENRIYRINYANVDEVERALSKFISKRGSISSNKGTSNVIVNDIESRIKAMDSFVAEIDRITPQVLVEARIYDVTCTDRLDLGIEWTAGRNSSYGTGTLGEVSTLGNADATERDPFMTGLFNGSIGKTNQMNSLFRVGWLNSAINIDVLLKAQKQIVNAKLLANPRVMVLDNEQALIRIIREIPYQEVTQTSGGGNIGSTSFRDVGISLAVVPHVTRDGMVRLQVSPEFSIDAGDVTVGTGTTSFPQPQVDRREAQSTLLLRSGQTMVLGGLRKKEVSAQENKIPLLGDLPIIGIVFKSNAEESIFSEMVVFVTPWIIVQPDMSDEEKELYKNTDFEGPCATMSNAEDVGGECINCTKQ